MVKVLLPDDKRIRQYRGRRDWCQGCNAGFVDFADFAVASVAGAGWLMVAGTPPGTLLACQIGS